MGVIASLVLVPAKLFNKEGTNIKPGATIPMNEDSRFDIDKAWSEFHEVLRDMPEPLCFAILGEAFEENEDEELCDLIYVPPPLTRKIDAALRRFTEEQMIAALKQKKLVSRASRATYEREHYKNLKRAYRTAAKAKAGLGICIG